MFNFDRSDVQRMAGAAIGALLLSATFVGAAIVPGTSIGADRAAVVAQAPDSLRG